MNVQLINPQLMNPVALWPTVAVVVVAAVTDLRSRRIPNLLVLPFLALGLASSAVAHGWTGLGQSLLGILLAVVAFGVFCLLGAMGMGDLKLAAAVGAWIGPSQLLVALVMTSLIGGVIALGWAAMGGFLVEALRGSAGLVLGRRKGLTLANPAARKMPYAPAIALGTILSFLSR
jgi:prepilin peptidase CpaA